MSFTNNRGSSALAIVLAVLGIIGMFSDRMTVMTVTTEMTIATKTAGGSKAPPPLKKPKHEIANFLPGVLAGMMDAHPPDLAERIVVSFRGNSTYLPVHQAVYFLQQHCDTISESLGSADFRVGLSFLEMRPRGTRLPFTSLVEFLVLGYQSLHSLASACSNTATHPRPENWSLLRKGNPSVHVPWIYVPTRNIKDVGEGHSMAVDAALRAFVSTATRNRQTTKFFGYEANDDRTRATLGQPSDILTAHEKVQSHVRYHEMVATADAMVVLKSSDVPNDNLWLELNEFPFVEWQNDVQKALEGLTPTIANEKNKTIICYLDQQKNKQFKLPEGYHRLLKQHFSVHKEVDLILIDSESPLDILYLRAQCPVLMGSQSPLLSSIALFLPPGVRIIEHGWDPDPTAFVSAQVIAQGFNYPFTSVSPRPQLDTEVLRKIMLKGFAPLETFLEISPLRIKGEARSTRAGERG